MCKVLAEVGFDSRNKDISIWHSERVMVAVSTEDLFKTIKPDGHLQQETRWYLTNVRLCLLQEWHSLEIISIIFDESMEL